MSDRPPVFRGPFTDYPFGEHIDGWIDRQASLRPEATALRWRGQEVSYADLVVDAETMAVALARRGVGPGDVVTVRMRRGPRMVAALLAVLKRGAAYAAVPLDWPRARHEQLAGLVKPRLQITGAGGAWRGDAVTASSLLREGLRLPPEEPPGRGSGQEPCCVFLTSGSTGSPKAVLAPHRAVVRAALDPVHVLDGPMHSLQSASVAWDVFALELWVPLMRGGTCTLHEEGHLTAAGIRAAVAGGVNVLALPAVLFNAALDDDPGCLAGVELMVTGGERASARHFSTCLREHPGLRLVHAYGPVEVAIAATAHVVTAVDEGGQVPIGRPIANTAVYLLDEDRRISAPGEVGELAVGGDGLAHGYLGDPGATADRFPTLDLDGRPRRVYLTGDLARVDEDGNLVFVGRRDRQVKLRGFRVEPGEVEHAVERVPGVGRAAAITLPVGHPSPERLAAFYTPAPDAPAPAPPDTVREHLLGRLPEVFVPAVLVPLPALPLLANGKVDYAALPALLPAEPATGSAAEHPEDPEDLGTELKTVLEIAGDLLGRTVRSQDDLFALGGTSLTAVRMANRLRTRLGRAVGAAEILELRTCARIAGLIETGAADRPEPEERAPEWADGLPCNQYRFWLAEWLDPEADQALIGMRYRLTGPVDRAALAEAVDTVVGWHEALRTRLPAVRRRPVIEVLDPAGLPSAFTVAEPADPAAARTRAEAFARRRYHIGQDVPLGVLLIPLGPDDHLLVLSAHHSGFDGWSEVLFWRDVSLAYTELVNGRRPPYRVPASFHRVIARQERWEASRFDAACRYWADRLGGMPGLPLGDVTADVGPAAEIPLRLGRPLLERAAVAAARAGGTATALFLAAYVRALRAHTGAADFPVTVPVAGRSIPEAENVIGCFASLITLRFTEFPGDPAGAVAAAAAGLRAAVDSPVVPIDRLYEPPPGTPRHPLLQVRFAMHNYAPGRIDLPGVACEGERIGPPVERSDVAFEVWPEPRPRAMLRYRADVLTEADARLLGERCVSEAESLVELLSP